MPTIGPALNRIPRPNFKFQPYHLPIFCFPVYVLYLFDLLLPFATTRFGITSGQAGMYSSIPLYCRALAMWGGGTLVDYTYKTGRWKLSRSLTPIGFALAMISIATPVPANRPILRVSHLS